MPNESAKTTARDFAAVAAYLGKRGRNHEAALWAVLRYLNTSNRSAATTSAFAAIHGVTEGAASTAIKRLTRIGLVGQTSDESDNRKKILTLTDAGQQALLADPLRNLAAALSREFKPKELALVGLSIARLSDSTDEWCECKCIECGIVIESLEQSNPDPISQDDVSQFPLSRESADEPPTEQAMALMRALALLARCMNRKNESYDLTRIEWTLLSFFATVDNDKSNLKTYTERHAVSGGAASTALSSLREKGLVVNEITKPNRVSHRVRITDAGTERFHQSPNLKIAAALAPHFSEHDLRVISKALNAILAQANDLVPAPLESRSA